MSRQIGNYLAGLSRQIAFPFRGLTASALICTLGAFLYFELLFVLQVHFLYFKSILFPVLGEKSFKSLADIETPSGMSQDLSIQAGPSQADALDVGEPGPAAFLSSTVIDGASGGASSSSLDVSSIPTEVVFCEKCGQIFQK